MEEEKPKIEDKIKVGIRMRPIIPGDTDNKQNWIIKEGRYIYQASSQSKQFEFDRVFTGEEDNLVVYGELCQPIVNQVMQGFNGTIFAYGQTASGKTYTMMGEHNGIIEGVIHYAISDIFETIQLTPERIYLLRVAFLEIYMEKVYNLLSNKKDELTVYTDNYGNTQFWYHGTHTDLKHTFVNNQSQVIKVIRDGLKRRQTGETAMNQGSSRSHCIFRMIIESRLRDEDEEKAKFSISHLNLVDLAGSENAKQTKAQAERFKEGTHINQSLSTLSRVIRNLSGNNTAFINYRESNLTRILQNSLGGDSLTAIICTVTPSSTSENISTLKFAEAAKKIKNKPKKNEKLSEEALLKKYERKIKELASKLEASKEQGKALEEKTKQNETLKKEIEALKSITVPLNFQKSNRRETWGGHLDARCLQKAFSLPHLGRALLPPLMRNPLPQLSGLTTLEEEPEGDLEITDVDFDLTFKRKKSSSVTSTNFNFSSPKNISHVETQTEKEVSLPPEDIFDDLYKDVTETRLAEMKTEILRLKKELSELNEYSALELQFIKAESELQKEIEALKTENITLKKALESSSTLHPPEPVSTSNDISEWDQKIEKTNSVFADKSDNSNKISFHTELGSPSLQNLVHEVTSNSVDESGISADESMKSHFLTLYDECIESETISKLKSDIESLKYDNSLKEQKINLLKEKIEIKDQMISSLKDEIMLVKTDSNESVASDNCGSNIYTNGSLDSDCQVKEYVDNQTSPLRFVKDIFENETQTSFNSLSMSPKECQTSFIEPVKDYMHRTCQTDAGILRKDSRECQTSPLKAIEKIYSHTISQTEFNSPYKNIKNTQTSPIRLENVFKIHKCCQTCSNSPIKSLKECQTSPLKLEINAHVHKICQTDFNSPVKSIKNCQTSPLKLKVKGSDELYHTGFDSPLKNSKDSNTVPLKSSHTNIKCYKCSNVTISDTVDVLPLKLENSSNFDLKVELEQKIVTLNDHIMTLEFNVKEKEEYAELLGNQLDLKNEEVISLSLKLSESKLSLDKLNADFSKLTEGISNLKQSISQLTFMCEMLNNVESESEFTKLKKLSEMNSSSQYSIPLHDITLIHNMILKLNSSMEENASKIINLTTKLKAVESELFAIQKQSSEKELHMSLEKSSDCIQPGFISEVDSVKIIENNEDEKLSSQCKKELKLLEEKNKELQKCNEDLKHKMKDLEEYYSAQIFDLETNFQTAKSEWNIKTMQLIKDLEAKYDQELNDQENKFDEGLCKKLQDMKQEQLKQLFKKEEEFRENIAKIKSSHNAEVLQLQKQIKDVEDQLFTECLEKENLRHQFDKEKELEIITIRKKFEVVLDKYKERVKQYKNDIFQLKYQLQHFIEEIDELKKRNPPQPIEGDEPVSQQLKEKLDEITHEKDLLFKKYTLAKQHIGEMKEELKKKLQQLSDQEGLLQKLSCNTAKETEETNKQLLYELDQKKAKIISLEINNASMVQELKKLKDMLSSKNTLSCKTNTKGSKNDIPARLENCNEKKTEPKRECEVVQENQVVRKAALEEEGNQKENENPSGKNAEQEKILCIGGGSGPANMVKNYWLEGIIHKKDKEIAKLKKELTDRKCETQTLHPVSSEKKINAESNSKAPVVPISVSPLQELDEHVTVHATALHPYPQGTVPKVQAKQILKERNRRISGKPYDPQPKTLHPKIQDMNSNRHHVLMAPKENYPTPQTKEHAVKFLAEGDPECKQM